MTRLVGAARAGAACAWPQKMPKGVKGREELTHRGSASWANRKGDGVMMTGKVKGQDTSCRAVAGP